MGKRQSQIKIFFIEVLVFTLFMSSVYAVSTALESPADNFIDEDGFLDLRASCTPTTFDGTSSYNITNAILYSNADGIWKAGQIQEVVNPIANSTYLFNFTNVLTGLVEGEFKWNAQCHEANSSNDGLPINKTFAGNRTIKVVYAKPTVTTTSPEDRYLDTDGYEIEVICAATPTSGWNITRLSMLTDLRDRWEINQTYSPIKPIQDNEVSSSFTINKFGNSSIADGTIVLFGCSAVQIKNSLEGSPVPEKSSSNRTIIIVYPPQQCIDGACDLTSQRWCVNNTWKEGVYSEYCSHCSYSDKNCPVCTNNICDLDNREWCNNGAWSLIAYCSNCTAVDASCAGTCTNNICDTKNREWCNNGAWDKSNYCINCNDADASCSFKCLNNACDVKNKKWCDNGAWKQADYIAHCSNKDFYYGTICQTSICDVVFNRWCDAGSWTSYKYCDYCDDSDCLGTCINNACDINSKKWCNNGAWVNVDYCSNCGNKDSSCSVACKEGKCDTTSNKRCFNGVWNSTNYCDYCSSADSDCTIVCAEGECDAINKRVCINSEWNSTTESIYCSFCSSRDTTCGVGCLAIADGCCLNTSDSVCDLDCAVSLDPDCGNCTSAQGNCCFPKNDTICDLDCAAGLDYDCTDAGCKDSGTCKIGANCTTNIQCTSSFCLDGKCTDQCKDKLKDGNETDVDCGGSCGKCSVYKKCKLDSDCSSDFCSSGTCLDEDICNDKILDGDETDVDCGGSCPNKCQEEQDCDGDNDCDIGLECIFNLCLEKTIVEQPVIDEEKDSDNDGILDKWELKHGLDLLDPSDAGMDFDKDGLTNLQEYTFGTDPNDPDTDHDKVSDKKEIEIGTNPLDPISKPGGIGGLLFLATILIILFGAGGYGVFYYIHYVKSKSRVLEPSFAPTYMPQKQYAPPRPVPRKDLAKIKVENVVQKRREEKKQLREKIFGVFDNLVESKPNKLEEKTKEETKKTPLISPKKEKPLIKQTQKPDVFSKLEGIYKKEEENREK